MIGAVFLAAVSGFAQPYSVVDLGVFTNSLSKANAINNSNQIAGTLNINGFYRAVLYGGAWTNLGSLGGTSSFGQGMNDSLQVVGRSRLTNGTVNRAFLWTPGGTNGIASNPQMKDLGTLAGGSEAAAEDINASGQVAGYSDNGSVDHAIRYTGATKTDIGSLTRRSDASSGLAQFSAGEVTRYSRQVVGRSLWIEQDSSSRNGQGKCKSKYRA